MIEEHLDTYLYFHICPSLWSRIWPGPGFSGCSPEGSHQSSSSLETVVCFFSPRCLFVCCVFSNEIFHLSPPFQLWRSRGHRWVGREAEIFPQHRRSPFMWNIINFSLSLQTCLYCSFAWASCCESCLKDERGCSSWLLMYFSRDVIFSSVFAIPLKWLAWLRTAQVSLLYMYLLEAALPTCSFYLLEAGPGAASLRSEPPRFRLWNKIFFGRFPLICKYSFVKGLWGIRGSSIIE